MTEGGLEQLYSTRTKGDEVLLQNEVPKEQEEVDDQQQMEPRDDLCCPTKKPKEMVEMIDDGGRVMMMIGQWERVEVVALVQREGGWGEDGFGSDEEKSLGRDSQLQGKKRARKYVLEMPIPNILL